ncbi:MAG: hypothetical protein ABIK39_02180 [candidate division WOR-3 bacterium]
MRKRSKESRLWLKNKWLWGLVGVVLLFILFFLTKILSQPPNPQEPPESLKLNKVDLIAYSRMLGEIGIDTSFIAILSVDFVRELRSIDTMIANRELRDAIARLGKMKRNKTPLERAVIQGYIGICYNELAQPTEALKAFQEGLKGIDTTAIDATGRVLGWLAFNAGYLWQNYSLPESALKYYQLSQRGVFSLLPAPAFTGALFNNLGVAAEMSGDTLEAKRAYLAATGYIDTTASDRAGQRLKENIHRLTKEIKPPPAGQHQP